MEPVRDHLTPLVHPDAPIDPDDNDMRKVEGQTSESSIPSSEKNKIPKKKVMTEGMSNDQRKADILNNMVMQGPTHNPHSPRLNIYLRPVEKRDVPEILGIYNHYITKTIYSPEMEPIAKKTIEQRMKDVDEAKLPWLVAVHRSSKASNRKTQHIVGFGFADDFADITSMYR